MLHDTAILLPVALPCACVQVNLYKNLHHRTIHNIDKPAQHNKEVILKIVHCMMPFLLTF